MFIMLDHGAKDVTVSGSDPGGEAPPLQVNEMRNILFGHSFK